MMAAERLSRFAAIMPALLEIYTLVEAGQHIALRIGEIIRGVGAIGPANQVTGQMVEIDLMAKTILRL